VTTGPASDSGSSPPGPEDVAEAVRSGRAPSDLSGAELSEPPPGGPPVGAPGARRAAAAGADTPLADGPEPSDDGVGTTPSQLPPTAPGEDGYADSPERLRLPEAPGLDDRPVAAGGVSVATSGAAVLAARDTALSALVEEGVARRIAEKDPTLWGPDAAPDASARLGWLDLPGSSRSLLPRLTALRDELAAEGLDRVVLLGAGGPALAAETVARSAGADLVVLDGPDPGQVRAALADPARTAVVVTGTGPVDAALRRLVATVLRDAGTSDGEVGRRFVAVAEPGSPLAQAAEAERFRTVLPAEDDVAAPFGALSAAALVPAVLAGADAAVLLDAAAALLPELARDEGPGLALGAVLGGAGVGGRDTAVLAPDADCPPGLAAWVEQLLAGATGKEGRGLLPVVVEAPDAPGTERQADTHLVLLGGQGPLPGEPPQGTRVTGSLGALFLLWEHAAAVAAHVLRVDPFDLPEVREVEEATGAALAGSPADPAPPALVDGAVQVHDEGGLLPELTDLRSALDALLAAVPLGGHLAVTAHLDPRADAEAARLRPVLARRLAHPVTFGWGARAVRTTGQHHRGGPPAGAHLVLTGKPREDLPGGEGGLPASRLQAAQAQVDIRTLLARGRPVLRLHLTDRAAGLAHLLDAVT
jgi:glucose-6-phosphate isomerase